MSLTWSLIARPSACGRLRAAGLLLALAALAALAALGACASRGGVPPDPTVPPEIDYSTRHERMLEVVIERPLVLEMQRQERLRRAQRDTTAAWEAVAERQRIYEESQRRKEQASDAFYQRLLERQQKHMAERERDNTERWARFIESNPPPSSPEAEPAEAP